MIKETFHISIAVDPEVVLRQVEDPYSKAQYEIEAALADAKLEMLAWARGVIRGVGP